VSIVDGGGGSEGGRMDELRMGMVVMVLCESGQGRRSSKLRWVDVIFARTAGLGFVFESDFGRGFGANSSSEDVILMTSVSGTGLGFGFFNLVFVSNFEFESLLDLTLDGVSVDFVVVLFRERIFARSASVDPYLLSKPTESPISKIDMF
jgi:hypothetical protein